MIDVTYITLQMVLWFSYVLICTEVVFQLLEKRNTIIKFSTTRKKGDKLAEEVSKNTNVTSNI